MKRIHLFYIVPLMIILNYLGGNAFAFGFAEPLADDMSRSFLNQVFGGLLDGGQDAYGDAIGVFNGAILILGGILASYTVFAGTMGTAHDGEMLGKKFSSTWIPIRYCLGTACILPVLSGGYCIMQGIVMWLIMQGVGMANGVWEIYMKNPPQLSAMSSTQPSEAVLKFVEDTYLMNLCVIANQKLREGGWNDVGDVAYSLLFEDQSQKWDVSKITKVSKTYKNPIDPRANQYLLFGINQGIISSYNCGEIHYMGGKADNNSASDNTISDSTKSTEYTISSFDSIKTKFKSPDYSPILIEHYNQIDKVVEKTKAIANKHVGKNKKTTDADYEELYKLAFEYHDAIKARSKEVTENHALKHSATKEGWFMAGAWATQIILHQNKLNSALNATPQISKFNFGPDRKKRREEFFLSVNGAVSLVSPYNDKARNYLSKTVEGKEADGDEEDENPNISIEGDIGIYLAKFVSGLDLEGIKDDKRHPLIIMSTVGNAILTSIMQAIIFIFGASVAASFWSGFSSTFITFFGTFAIPLAGFIGIGATLAYLIPNLPFLIWIGIIIGWTIMCVEAIIVAPLWAVMHLHPSGDDLTGKGSNGYMLVLGLTLRPVLIIFGLISAIVLSGLFGQLINSIFLDIFLLNQGDGGLGFFSALFGAGLYSALMMIVIKQTFSLMHVLPDQILRWIGGGQEQLGQYAGASIDSMAKASVIGSAASGIATGTSFRGVKGIADDFSDLKQSKIKENSNNSIGNFSNEKNAETQNGDNEAQEKTDLNSVKGRIESKEQ